MARRSIPQEPRHASLTVEQMRTGIRRINKRIEDLEQFDPTKLKKRWAPEVKALEAAIDETLAAVFGHGTVEYNRYVRATGLDHGGMSMVVSWDSGGEVDDGPEARRYVAEGKQEAILLLGQAVRGLEEAIEAKEEYMPQAAIPGPHQRLPNSRKVFIVHGHDDAAREALARFLAKIDLEPIILNEQVSGNRTIIEKIEEYGDDVGFAVVLLTPDDAGAAMADKDKLQPRARQNVIFELGYFIGRLGRNNVCALKKGDLEVLSDYAGVVYTAMDAAGAWKTTLAREIDSVGIEIDFNKAMRS
jgi:predicted nucleotide-binding protein